MKAFQVISYVSLCELMIQHDQESKTSTGFQGQRKTSSVRVTGVTEAIPSTIGVKTAKKVLNITHVGSRVQKWGASVQQQKMASPLSPHWLKSSSEGPSALRDRCWGWGWATAPFIMRTHGVTARPTHRVHAWTRSFLVPPYSQWNMENWGKLRRSSWLLS